MQTYIIASSTPYRVTAGSEDEAWRKYAIALLKVEGTPITESEVQHMIAHHQDEDLMYLESDIQDIM